MRSPAPADLQRWSEEVARDAASLSFLPLARAYRRQGRRDAALRLCLRGLEHHPSNVEGHALLAIIYFESGQRLKAYDEWSMVLTLEPNNFDALRGMGFYYLEQEDHAAARKLLERAAKMKSSDPAVQEGLRMIAERLGEVKPAPAPQLDAAPVEPWEQEAVGWTKPAKRTEPTLQVEIDPPQPPPPPPTVVAAPAAVAAPAVTEVAAVAAPPAINDDPALLFEPIMRGGQVLGALLLDSQGLVMAGSLGGTVGAQAESLGAILGGAIDEAVRTAQHLSLGKWSGILLEAETAVLHFAPVQEGMIVLLAAQRNAPAGWVLRSAHQAAVLATRFLEAYA
jgi:tetratricopeptide (TPR) repeat protein